MSMSALLLFPAMATPAPLLSPLQTVFPLIPAQALSLGWPELILMS